MWWSWSPFFVLQAIAIALHATVSAYFFLRARHKFPISGRNVALVLSLVVAISIQGIVLTIDATLNGEVPCGVSLFELNALYLVLVVYFLRMWRLWFVFYEQQEKGRSPSETGLWFYKHRRYMTTRNLLATAFIASVVLWTPSTSFFIYQSSRPDYVDNPPLCSGLSESYNVSSGMAGVAAAFAIFTLFKLRKAADGFLIHRELRQITVLSVVYIVFANVAALYDAAGAHLAFWVASWVCTHIGIFVMLDAPLRVCARYEREASLCRSANACGGASDGSGDGFCFPKNFHDVLEDAALRAKFMSHLEREFSVENLLFYEAATEFLELCECGELSDTQDRNEAAVRIFYDFIRRESRNQVNIAGAKHVKIVKELNASIPFFDSLVDSWASAASSSSAKDVAKNVNRFSIFLGTSRPSSTMPLSSSTLKSSSSTFPLPSSASKSSLSTLSPASTMPPPSKLKSPSYTLPLSYAPKSSSYAPKSSSMPLPPSSTLPRASVLKSPSSSLPPPSTLPPPPPVLTLFSADGKGRDLPEPILEHRSKPKQGDELLPPVAAGLLSAEAGCEEGANVVDIGEATDRSVDSRPPSADHGRSLSCPPPVDLMSPTAAAAAADSSPYRTMPAAPESLPPLPPQPLPNAVSLPCSPTPVPAAPVARRAAGAASFGFLRSASTLSMTARSYSAIHFNSVKIVDATIFENARAEILNLMQSDTFMRFLLQLYDAAGDQEKEKEKAAAATATATAAATSRPPSASMEAIPGIDKFRRFKRRLSTMHEHTPVGSVPPSPAIATNV